MSETLKFDYLRNEKNFRSEIKTFFLASQVLSFRHKIKTSKNVADTSFNVISVLGADFRYELYRGKRSSKLQNYSNVAGRVFWTKLKIYMSLTLFFPMFPFDPPENIRKPLVFCFQGDLKGALGRKGLKHTA